MKLIFSRKGFDSTAGGVASPIVEGQELFSLPIPEHDKNQHPHRVKRSYSQICIGEHNLGKVVGNLRSGTKLDNSLAHLDPDLIHSALERRPTGWKPALGQAGAAQGHLRNQNVGVGDIFLFYGWFRDTRFKDGHYSYLTKGNQISKGKHVIFGWLQVGEVRKDENYTDWAQEHVHFKANFDANTLYVASDKLKLNENLYDISGAGAFKQYEEQLCLTSPNQHSSYNRCLWKLPAWLTNYSITYHPHPQWKIIDEYHVTLNATQRGQEFVVALDEYPPSEEAFEWLHSLLTCSTTWD